MTEIAEVGLKADVLETAKAMFAYDEKTQPVRYNVRYVDLPGYRRHAYEQAAEAAIAVLSAHRLAHTVPEDAGLREALVKLRAAAFSTLTAMDAYNDKHGTYIGGPAFFELGRSVVVADAALSTSPVIDTNEGLAERVKVLEAALFGCAKMLGELINLMGPQREDGSCRIGAIIDRRFVQEALIAANAARAALDQG